jgi:hypothetical protein
MTIPTYEWPYSTTHDERLLCNKNLSYLPSSLSNGIRAWSYYPVYSRIRQTIVTFHKKALLYIYYLP